MAGKSRRLLRQASPGLKAPPGIVGNLFDFGHEPTPEELFVLSVHRDTPVLMAQSATHCVVTKWDEAIVSITGWLAREVA